MSHHVFRDGGFGDLDAQFQQLAMNARCTPARVVAAHHPNQIPNLLRALGRPGLPRWIFHVQNKRNPFRCQATTVSALTIIRAVFQSLQTSSQSQSPEDSIGRRQVSRFGAERRSTTSCCRSARFSSRSCADVLNAEASMVGARCSVIAATTRGIDGCRSTQLQSLQTDPNILEAQ